MSWSGWEAYRLSGSGWEASRMSGSGRETLLDVREDLPDIWEWSGGPTVYPGMVSRPTRMTGSGRETPRMCGRSIGMCGRYYRMSRSYR